MSEEKTTPRPMGIGKLGDISFKPKKFRWLVEILSSDEKTIHLPPTFCKVPVRPQNDIEETELNFLNDKHWIPGKLHEWKTIEFSFYDVNSDQFKPLFEYAARYFEKTPDTSKMSEEERLKVIDDYFKNNPELLSTCKLKLLGPTGELLETWIMYECWMSAINFGELDHSSTESFNINVTFKYKNIKYESATCPPPGTVL